MAERGWTGQNGPVLVHPAIAGPSEMPLALTLTDVSADTWCQDITSQPKVLGRDETADIRFKHRTVSRKHCRFWSEGDTSYVEDCGSTNGTYVNDSAVDATSLSPGDRVLVGKFDMLVVDRGSVSSTVDEIVGMQTTNQKMPLIEPDDPDTELRRLATAVYSRLTPSMRIGVPSLLIEVGHTASGVLGGDCFKCFDLGDDHWALATIDSMYHGPKAALAATLLHSELERWMTHTAQPSKCLQWINSELLSLQTEDIYFCAGLAIWSPKTQMLVYSTAGLHPPVLIRSGKCHSHAATADGLPLGVRIDEDYGEQLLELQHKDRIFFFTDGVHEALRTKDTTDSVGMTVERRLLETCGNSLTDQMKHLMSFDQGRCRDDVLLVGCEVQSAW
jgi:hypothetical protein